MKKMTFLLTVFSTSVIFCAAQTGGYKKGDKLLNAGVGVNSYYNGGFPLGASLEFGVSDEISIGPNVDYISNKYDYGYGYSYKFTTLYLGVRGSYHVNDLLGIESDKVDLYGGLTIGYRSFKWKDTYSNATLSNSYGSGVYAGAYVGGKYFISKNVGAFVELGAIGSTNARVGIGFKF